MAAPEQSRTARAPTTTADHAGVAINGPRPGAATHSALRASRQPLLYIKDFDSALALAREL
jgi:hypothetical protein